MFKLLKSFCLVVVLVFCGVSPSLAKEEVELRMFCWPNTPLAYKVSVSGDIVFSVSSKLTVTDKQFGDTIDPKATFEDTSLTQYPALPYAFVNPSVLGFSKESAKQNIDMSLGWLFGHRKDKKIQEVPVPCAAQARSTSRGWNYTFKFDAANTPRPIYMSYYKTKGLYKVNEFTVSVTTSFDVDKRRVKSSTLKYAFTLAPREIPEADKHHADYRDEWKKPKTLKGTVKLSSPKEVKPAEKAPGYQKGKYDKYIDLGVEFLLKKLRDPSSWGWKAGDFAKYHGGGTNQVVAGEMALAWFACFRGGLDPNIDEVGEALIKFVEFAENDCGYKGKADNIFVTYSAGAILMMIESALNPINSDGALDPKADKKEIAANYRIKDKKVVSELLRLAQHLTNVLANVDLYQKPDKYGQVPTVNRGHLWSYAGKRGFDLGGTLEAPHVSTAQYAVLGLRCSRLIGLYVPDDVWEDVHHGYVEDCLTLTEAIENHQINADKVRKIIPLIGGGLEMSFEGGVVQNAYTFKTNEVCVWPYNTKAMGYSPYSFNMVCTALGNLAMAYSYLPDKAHPEMKKTMAKGLLYCQIVLDELYENLNYYDYYSWERVAVFYGVTKVKGKDWHGVMSDKIIEAQVPSGEFKLGPSPNKGKHYDFSDRRPLLSTAYAVLFLKRATRKLHSVYTVTSDTSGSDKKATEGE